MNRKLKRYFTLRIDEKPNPMGRGKHCEPAEVLVSNKSATLYC